MIRRRKNKRPAGTGGRNPSRYEYELTEGGYNGWFNIQELSDMPECVVSYDRVKSRIAKTLTGAKTHFPTLWMCMTIPTVAEGNMRKGISNRSDVLNTDTFNRTLLDHMPVTTSHME